MAKSDKAVKPTVTKAPRKPKAPKVVKPSPEQVLAARNAYRNRAKFPRTHRKSAR